MDTLDQVDRDAREYRYDADIGFTGGTSSPSTWGVRILANTFDYDETGSNLTPRTTVNPQANWQLRLTPVLSGALFGGYYYYNADNTLETEIRVAEADAGVIYEPSEVLRLGFGLGYADRRREETRDGVRDEVEHETGPVLRGNLRYVLPDLTLTGDARWTTASAEDNHFSGSLGGFYALPRGMLRGRIYQRAVGDSTGNEVRVTGATIGLEREINTVSRHRPRLRLGDPGQPRGRHGRARHHPHRLHRQLRLRPHRLGDRRGRLQLPDPRRGSDRHRQPPGLPGARQDLRDRALRARGAVHARPAPGLVFAADFP